MAVGDYKLDIPDFPEVRANKELKFDNVTLRYQTGEDPDTFEFVEGAQNRSVVISALTVTQIANGPGTNAEKRAQVIQLVENAVMDWGVVESDAAIRAFESLLPDETWPEGGYTITLDLI